MKMKKMLSVSLALTMTFCLASCSSDSGTTTGGSGGGGSSSSSSGPSVYYLNFKPEQATQWVAIGEAYTAETGIPVKIMTAAGGDYEKTLKAEMSKSDAPTLFQINGPIGYQAWKDFTLDLSDTDFYSWLSDPTMAITDGDGVFAVPYVVEGYGIIYNEAIMEEYFALSGAKASSMDDINNFTTFSAVVEDMTTRKDELGIEGVFSSTSFTPGEDWRWNTHLMNVPVYYEYLDAGVGDKAELDFTYNENFKNIFDLYINNSITAPTMLGAKSVGDSMAEFALGKSAMVQNGNWGWGQIADVDGNTVLAEDVKFLPIYTGVKGEETQSICVGTENYFCINSQSSSENQQASIDFVEWVFGSDAGREMVVSELGFISPFNTFSADENPSDPLAQEVVRYMNDPDFVSVSWNFTSFPSQTFKDNFGASLLQYASGSMAWDDVVTYTVEDWAVEKDAIS